LESIATIAGGLAGDTGMGLHFGEIKNHFAPFRLVLLPIGAYLPRWFMHPIHLSPTDAVEVHRILQPGVSMAIHFGTFALGDDGESADSPLSIFGW
jgi:L-ascorbate metabolism protein UlaG (beta-lactamase superfamily)